MNLKQFVIDNGFRTLGWTGVPRLAVPHTRGLGAILMLHHVRPWHGSAYAPNRELEITPEFFDAVLQHLNRSGWIVVTMDDAVERITAGRTDRPFVVLTFDDGYRDTLEWALPIMQREKVPATLFMTQGFVERTATMWWLDIEESIRHLKQVNVRVRGVPATMRTQTEQEKQRAAFDILRSLRNAPQYVIEAVRAKLLAASGIDPHARVAEWCMDKRDLVDAANHPLLAIGAHTRTHPMLASLAENEALAEMVEPKAWLESVTGKPVRHFAYPVGKPNVAGRREFRLASEAGFVSAVTTRPGMVFAEHAPHLLALPRLSLNGRYQSIKEFEMLLSGLPFALWNAFRRVNAG